MKKTELKDLTAKAALLDPSGLTRDLILSAYDIGLDEGMLIGQNEGYDAGYDEGFREGKSDKCYDGRD